MEIACACSSIHSEEHLVEKRMTGARTLPRRYPGEIKVHGDTDYAPGDAALVRGGEGAGVGEGGRLERARLLEYPPDGMGRQTRFRRKTHSS